MKSKNSKTKTKTKTKKNKTKKINRTRNTRSVSSHKINGYNVLLIDIPDSELVYIQSHVNVGFLFENKRNSGINHLLEHILVNSWEQCSKFPCLEVLSKKGIQCNAHTGLTNVNYHTTSTQETLYEMLDYITTITTKAKITKRNLDIEINPVINELKQYGSDPKSELWDLLQKEMFCIEGGKYSDDWELQMKNLKHITLSDVKKYYEDYYIPERVSFIICGNINKNAILEKMKMLIPSSNNCSVTPCINYKKCFNNLDENKYIFNKNSTRKNSVCAFNYYLSNIENHILLSFSLKCLRHELFMELRYNKKLVYYLNCSYKRTHCGYVITISYETSNDKIKISHDSILSIIEKYKSNLFSKQNITSRKKHEKINFGKNNLNNPEFISQYYSSQFIFDHKHMYSPEYVLKYINQINNQSIKKTINKSFNNFIFGYQSNKQIKF